jgi:Ca2+-binding RTX toxin-like protein
VDRIVIYSNGGDDRVSISGNVTKRVILDGGLGNDLLNGGAGGNIILGGGGNDHVIGGGGNDILIGGTGADSLDGQSGQDVLVGGYSSYDSDLAQWRELDSLFSRWNSSGNFAARIADLRTPADPSSPRLAVRDTIFNDDTVDELIGGPGTDWFMASVDGRKRDFIRDLALGEVLDDLLK